jgi:hypothetical protein
MILGHAIVMTRFSFSVLSNYYSSILSETAISSIIKRFLTLLRPPFGYFAEPPCKMQAQYCS